MYEIEASAQYALALKMGKKSHREEVHKGRYPFLQVLDEILENSMVEGQQSLGILEIPIEKIVGTKTRGRTTAFAANFMPLLPENSEFGFKWKKLCEAHLSAEGIREPIRCYEYLGRFYVQEGNKRVSVLKSYGALTIPGYVIRVIPSYSRDEEVQQYYGFLHYYPLTKLYQVYFTDPASFPKLQAALGYEADHVWDEEERKVFTSRFCNFNEAFQKLRDDSLRVTAADALLVWLHVYSYEDLKLLSPAEILNNLQAIWQDVRVLGQNEPISVETEAPEAPEKSLLGKLRTTIFPTHLKVAFIHELDPKESNWIRAHEAGRHYMENALGDRVETMVYSNVGRGEEAVKAMRDAAEQGADMIFTTTAPLIAACRRISVEYPDVKLLNCSISMPYTGVRTYYSRIYEGKFISGAIAGAVSQNDEIGYIASSPIFGVPAGINAFALGAQLTNPRAKIRLHWSCLPGDHYEELTSQGIDIISTLDLPLPGWEKGQWGTFCVLPDSTTKILASPFWNWGKFYVNLVSSVLNGSWDLVSPAKEGDRAVNYWWGMASGVIGVKLTDAIPAGVGALAEILENSIINDSITPFHRRVVSQDGTLQNDGTKYYTHDEILHMDWLCDNIDGSIPPYEALLEQSRGIVRLQGIYRDRILPEKEDVLL